VIVENENVRYELMGIKLEEWRKRVLRKKRELE
jgi:hypothetical protein